AKLSFFLTSFSEEFSSKSLPISILKSSVFISAAVNLTAIALPVSFKFTAVCLLSDAENFFSDQSKSFVIKSSKNLLTVFFAINGNDPFLLIKVSIILNVLIVNFSFTNLVKNGVLKKN